MMRVTLLVNGESRVVESEGPMTVNQLLERLGIMPSTVLVAAGERVIPHTTLIKSDVSLEAVIVSSGG